MEAVLFYVEPTAYTNELNFFIRRSGDIAIPEGARRLAPTVWLIDLLDGGEVFQQQLTRLATERGLVPALLKLPMKTKGPFFGKRTATIRTKGGVRFVLIIIIGHCGAPQLRCQ
jgi:hypothetical protein